MVGFCTYYRRTPIIEELLEFLHCGMGCPVRYSAMNVLDLTATITRTQERSDESDRQMRNYVNITCLEIFTCTRRQSVCSRRLASDMSPTFQTGMHIFIGLAGAGLLGLILVNPFNPF
jgi:hypothetical protein